LTCLNSTIALNDVMAGAGFFGEGRALGSGIYAATSTGGIGNTIIGPGSRPHLASDVFGDISSLGHNLISQTNDYSSGWVASDLTGSAVAPLEPRLSLLQNNGGPTPTMALLSDSPAIDRGKSFGLTTDQRGLPRVFDWPTVPNESGGDGSDIGAFELTAPALSITRSGSQAVLSWPASDLDFRLQSANALHTGTWTSVPDTPLIDGGTYRLTNSGPGTRKFYRLIKP
jgi:hypothetical protein